VATTTHLSVGIAFLAGLVSFVSPCVLPLVPAYLSFLTGSSIEELRTGAAPAARLHVIAHALLFVAGFTAVFVALGATASTLGVALRSYQSVIQGIGGTIVVILGLHMMGLLQIPFLMRDTRMHLRTEGGSYWMSAVVGIAFAAGWTPCIGPILSGIYALATQSQTVGQGAWLLFVYSLGLALPFLATAVAIDVVLPLLNRIKRFLRVIEIVSGAFLVIVGYVIASNSFLIVAGWFYQFVPQPKL
jgi:cytochrome c-type biogenesis protein